MNAFLLTVSLAAQTANPPIQIPDTPAGNFLREMLQAVNAPDDEAVRRFASAKLERDDLAGLGPANHLRRMERLRTQSGGLKLEGSAPDGGAVLVRAVRSGHQYVMRGYANAAGKGGFEIRRRWTVDERAGGYRLPEKVTNRKEAVAAIQAMLDALARQDRWNGVVIVAQGERILLYTAHGIADRTTQTPVGKDTKFNLASLGKMFTTVLIGDLARQGKLSLDDPLGKFRPDWPDEAAKKVTIRQILGHTAGFGTLFESPNYDRTRRYRNSTDMTDALKGEPLATDGQFRYSNGGFIMLGSVIESVTKRDYMDAARDTIFRPLGMNGTGWADGNEVVPNLAPVYDRDILDPLGEEPKRRDGMFAGWRGDAHGGGYSTAMDLFRFMRAVKTNRWIAPKEMEEFIKAGPNPGYGLGFSFDPAGGLKAVGHNGHARADASVLWDLDITVIALGNDLSEPTPFTAMALREFIAKQAAVFR
jgi:CubicO group peptidase (beta-lactamase class C family)